jgi:putative membrane protein
MTMASAVEMWHGRGYDPDWWGTGSWVGPLVALLVLAAIAAVTVYLLSRRSRRPPYRSGEAVLAERFARGEIDEDEYRTRLAVLRGP